MLNFIKVLIVFSAGLIFSSYAAALLTVNYTNTNSNVSAFAETFALPIENSSCPFNKKEIQCIRDVVTQEFYRRFKDEIPQLIVKTTRELSYKNAECVLRGAAMYYNSEVGACQYCPITCAKGDLLCTDKCQLYQTQMKQNAILNEKVAQLRGFIDSQADVIQQMTSTNRIAYPVVGVLAVIWFLVLSTCTAVLFCKFRELREMRAIFAEDDRAPLKENPVQEEENA